MDKEALISVIMPIYNPNEVYLKDAVYSILNQTYKNIEVLLVVDGDESTTKAVVEEINDIRLKIIRNDGVPGVATALNKGIENSLGEFIARMDADDISEVDRLQKQKDYLEKNPEIDLIGTYAKTFGAYETVFKSETETSMIKAELLMKNPIAHPTVMFRKSTILCKKITYTAGESEDYRMWINMVFQHKCKIAVLPEVLLNYRVHSNQATNRKKEDIEKSDNKIIDDISQALDISLSEAERETYIKIRNIKKIKLMEFMECKKLWKKLCENSGIQNVTFWKTNKIINKRLIKCFLKGVK